MAIGNGELSMYEQLNSILPLLYYRGTYGYDTDDSIPAAYYDYSSRVNIVNVGEAYPKDNTSYCDNLMVEYGVEYIWMHSLFQDVYNINQDCYRYQLYYTAAGSRIAQLRRKLDHKKPNIQLPMSYYKNQKAKINYDSTDGKASFYCFAAEANANYLQRSDVRSAIHIPSHYFWILINAQTEIKIRLDEWFVEKLAESHKMRVEQPRTPWYYQSQVAGYWKRFTYSTTAIDLLTVKGAGHFVPLDRPGPSLQMIMNFMNRSDYSTPYGYDTKLTPLREQYKILQKIIVEYSDGIEQISTKKAKNVIHKRDTSSSDYLLHGFIENLPFITFIPDFEQWAGYFTIDDLSIFFWFVGARKHQQKAASDEAVVVWLGDGPGCSPVADLFQDFGPYRLKVNTDGTISLNQNPFSWNQAGNFLFIETPQGVGYSKYKENELNDVETTKINLKVLKKFYENFKNYSNNPLFIGGKGYGSVLALKLTEAVLEEKSSIPKPSGVLLQNAMLSRKEQINSLPNLLYFSGEIGKESMTEADNFYENCYYMASMDVHKRKKRQAYHFGDIPLVNDETFIDQAQLINYMSTDAFASYPCYMNEITEAYLSKSEVKNALNVQYPGRWVKCNIKVHETYIQQYLDMTDTFRKLLSYPLRFLVYSGNAGLSNNFIANQWFVEKLSVGFKKSPHLLWKFAQSHDYLTQYAGYQDLYAKENVKIDLITVKGAGHDVALDRPLPTLQMFINYLQNEAYGTMITYLPEQPPISPPTPPPKISRREAAKIYDLPGLTFEINFDQYSGYLNASLGNYLFFWYHFLCSFLLENTDFVYKIGDI
ncbi:unnamed protein product [Thelazia callipaeda]|uniref:Serine carboxypeptidase n=1 Tax=Thelazia callipaeda TaxID=103827 RepID=A0A0N5CRS2_THECL|nr:unnamed protein product [Thelazia callipaeda]